MRLTSSCLLPTVAKTARRSPAAGGLTLLLAILLLGWAPAASAEERSAESLDQGRELYQQFCLVCHGASGQGTTLGPTISSAAVTAMPDTAISRVIAQGRSANGMPMFGRSLEREEISAIVDYIRTLQDSSAEKREERQDEAPPVDLTGGNIRAGQELFRGKANCVKCHTTFFVGGDIGPDLSDVAHRRSQADIYEAVTNPSDKVLREYRAKRLVTKDGRTIVGRYRNDNAESVQILNATGDLWTTYMKSNLESDKTVRDESLMPTAALADLNESEIKDLFAYLYSLK